MTNRPAPRRTAASRARQARPKPQTVTFLGSEYKIAEKIGVWPQMQLARAAESGMSAGDSKGLAAVHAYLEQVIHPDDWGRFQDDMISKRTDDLGGLMELLSEAVALVMDRQQPKQAAGRRTITGQVEDGDDGEDEAA